MNCNVLIGRSCWVIGRPEPSAWKLPLGSSGDFAWVKNQQQQSCAMQPNVGCSMTAALSCESDWSTRLSVKKIALCSVAVALSLHTSKLGFCLLGRRSGVSIFILFFIFYFCFFFFFFFLPPEGEKLGGMGAISLSNSCFKNQTSSWNGFL